MNSFQSNQYQNNPYQTQNNGYNGQNNYWWSSNKFDFTYRKGMNSQFNRMFYFLIVIND